MPGRLAGTLSRRMTFGILGGGNGAGRERVSASAKSTSVRRIAVSLSEVLESPDSVHVEHEADEVREPAALVRPEHLELHRVVAGLDEPEVGEDDVYLGGGHGQVLKDLAIAIAAALGHKLQRAGDIAAAQRVLEVAPLGLQERH